MFCLVADLLNWREYPAADLAALYRWRFLSALGVSAGVGVSSVRARAGCGNVAESAGSVSHRRIGVVKECVGSHILRGARRSRGACASRVPGRGERPAVAVGGLLSSLRRRGPARVQAVGRPLARMIAAVTRPQVVWCGPPSEPAGGRREAR